MRRVKWILSGILGAIALVVLAQNSASTTLAVLWVSIEVPQFVALLGALCVGAMLGVLGVLLHRR